MAFRFGEMLDRMMKKRGWTQSQLAEIMGVTRQNVSALMRQEKPHQKSMERVARAFNIDPAKFVANVKFYQSQGEMMDFINSGGGMYTARTQDQVPGSQVTPNMDSPFETLNQLIEKKSSGSRSSNELKKASHLRYETETDYKEFYDRLYHFMIERNISDKDMAWKLQIDTETLRERFRGDYSEDDLLPEKIAEFIPEINSEWLLTGRGEMIRAEHKDWGDFHVIREGFRLMTHENGNEIILLRDYKFLITCPLIKSESQLHYIENLDNPSIIEKMERYAIVMDYARVGAYRSFEVTDDHMEGDTYGDQIIYQGSIATGRRVERKYGRYDIRAIEAPVVVIVTSKQIIISRLVDYEWQNETLSYHGLNLEQSETTILIRDIVELYIVEVVTRELNK